jgi:WD40 repeat protein
MGATSRPGPRVLRECTTQPLGKSHGEWSPLISLHPCRPPLSILPSSPPALTTPEQSVLVNHDATHTRYFYIHCMCFSPDGCYFATGASDGKIRVRGSPCRSLTNILPLRLPRDSYLIPATHTHRRTICFLTCTLITHNLRIHSPHITLRYGTLQPSASSAYLKVMKKQ